jgi:S1-C subfamily serine protease
VEPHPERRKIALNKKFLVVGLSGLAAASLSLTVAMASAYPQDLPVSLRSAWSEVAGKYHQMGNYVGTYFEPSAHVTRSNLLTALYAVDKSLDKLFSTTASEQSQIRSLQSQVNKLQSTVASLQNALNTNALEDNHVISLAASIMSRTGQIQAYFKLGNGSPVKSIGSAFFVHDNQYVLTDDHVVELNDPNDASRWIQPDSITFVIGGSSYNATVVQSDRTKDLALLKLVPASGQALPSVKPLNFESSRKIEVGQTVIAVGSPLGVYDSVTKGIVSHTVGYRLGAVDAVQIDAPINEGNSGGPVVDMSGNVIGIVDFKYAYDDGQLAEGMGVATSVSTINEFLSSYKFPN